MDHKRMGEGVKRSQIHRRVATATAMARGRGKLDKDAARAIFGGTRIKVLPSFQATTING